MPTITNRIRSAWNAFTNKDPTEYKKLYEDGTSYGYYPDFRPSRISHDKSIITAVYNRIAIDVAAVDVKHYKVNKNGQYTETVDSDLNKCLTVSANIDQSGRAFIQDAAMRLMEEGVIAIIPVDCTANPAYTDSYDIRSMRIGSIVQWYPHYIKVKAYNELTGNLEERVFPKETTAVIQNPLYSTMNAPNSTLQRLIRKLALLDLVDEQNASGKLDLIIQLPYVIKTEARREQAENRRKDIELQLSSSKYGIAYTDGTERITQLNRSLENNILSEVQYLTSMLWSQLGITEEVFNGTANEEVMLNYHNRTIEPILSAITDEMTRKWLSKNAQTKGQVVSFIRDPFRLVPVNQMAEIADKFTRNAILSPNEIRSIIGYQPSDDPKSDELRNRNLNESEAEAQANPSIPMDDETNNEGDNAGESDTSAYADEDTMAQLAQLLGLPNT